jgi:hypothetical protein
MALAGSEERAGCEGSACVSTIHAPFPTEVECKMHGHSPENFESLRPSLIGLDAQDRVRLSRLKIVCRNLTELQMRIIQLAREGSPPLGLRLPQAELSRKSNQIARGRIRRFESYMPSQADRSLPANLRSKTAR